VNAHESSWLLRLGSRAQQLTSPVSEQSLLLDG
jgi:hypothetical protein